MSREDALTRFGGVYSDQVDYCLPAHTLRQRAVSVYLCTYSCSVASSGRTGGFGPARAPVVRLLLVSAGQHKQGCYGQ